MSFTLLQNICRSPMVLWGDEFDSYLADEPLSQQLQLPPSPTLQQLEQQLSSDSEPELSHQQLEQQGLPLDSEPLSSKPWLRQGLSGTLGRGPVQQLQQVASTALQQDAGLQQQQADLNVEADLSAAAAQVRAGSEKQGQGQRRGRDSEAMDVDEGGEVTAVRHGRSNEAARNAMQVDQSADQERGQDGSGPEGGGAGAVEGAGAASVNAGRSVAASTVAAGLATAAGRAAAGTEGTGAGAAGAGAAASAQAAAAGAAPTEAMGRRGSSRGPPPRCHPGRWVPPSKQLLPRSSIFYGTSCGRRAGLPSKGRYSDPDL